MTKVHSEPGTPRTSPLSALRARIMDLISDGKPWRSKHLIDRAGHGSKHSTVRTLLDRLAAQGLIVCPLRGVWTLAGIPAPSAAEVPPLNHDRRARPTEQKLLVMISAPVSAATLTRELGVSRQRVSQLLARLLEEGKAVRVPNPEGSARWLWSQPGAAGLDALRLRPPSLTEARRQVLNALEPDAFHSAMDIAAIPGQTIGTTYIHIQALEERGLVASLRIGSHRYVTITQRGLDDPARLDSATHAPATDFSKAFAERRLRFIETLAVLAEARTIDITAALAGRDKAGIELLSGQCMAGLAGSDYVEPVPGRTVGGRRFYRLTEAGKNAASLIARHRRPPAAEEVRERIAMYRARRAERQREIARGAAARRRHSHAWSPAQRVILDLLAAGTCSTPALHKAVRERMTSATSIYPTLKTLKDRGVIARAGRQGRAGVWALCGNGRGIPAGGERSQG